MPLVRFNMNDYVRVRLNGRGLALMQEEHNQLAIAVKRRGGQMEDWVLPTLDEQGRFRTQLWCLMQDFGKLIRLGYDQPFETEILLEATDTPVPTDLWNEILEFIDDHVDVSDGDSGEQVPNRAMSLKTRIDQEIK